MKTDILMEILEDGTVSIKTSDVADTQHLSADQLIDEIEALLGGTAERRSREHPAMKNRTVLRGGKTVMNKNPE